MKRALLAVVFFGLSLNVSGAMASMIGRCDALLAKFFGDEQQVVNGIDIEGNCNDLLVRINDFIDAGCRPLFDSGQLASAHIRPDLPFPQAACTALNCVCGFGVAECVGVVDCS